MRHPVMFLLMPFFVDKNVATTGNNVKVAERLRLGLVCRLSDTLPKRFAEIKTVGLITFINESDQLIITCTKYRLLKIITAIRCKTAFRCKTAVNKKYDDPLTLCLLPAGMQVNRCLN